AGRTVLVTPAGLVVAVRSKGIVATPLVGTGTGWIFHTRTGTGALVWGWGKDILVVDGTNLSLVNGASGNAIRTVAASSLLPGGVRPRHRSALSLTLGSAIAADAQQAYVSLGPATVALDRALKVQWVKPMDEFLNGVEVPTAAGGGYVVTQFSSS